MAKLLDKLLHKTKFKQPIDEKSVAMTLGLFSALAHLIHYLLTTLGGQALLDWMMRLHGVSVPAASALPFDTVSLVVSVVGGFAAAFVGGWVLAAIWNWTVKQKW